MAKDDFDFLVFKILTYLYACLKRKCSFEKAVFLQKLGAGDIPEEYLTDILRYMAADGLIAGVCFVHAWGNEYVLASDLGEMCITAAGIRYLLENDKMRQIQKAVLDGVPGALAELVKMAFPLAGT